MVFYFSSFGDILRERESCVLEFRRRRRRRRQSLADVLFVSTHCKRNDNVQTMSESSSMISNSCFSWWVDVWGTQFYRIVICEIVSMAIDMLRLWVWWISWWNRMVGIPVMIWSLMMIHVERRRSNIKSVQILHYIISLYMNRIVHVRGCGTPWPIV